jgi:hypothetical protein
MSWMDQTIFGSDVLGMDGVSRPVSLRRGRGGPRRRVVGSGGVRSYGNQMVSQLCDTMTAALVADAQGDHGDGQRGGGESG